MRLLHATTKKLVTFDDEGLTPPYVTLSHTWGDGEISFWEVSDTTDPLPESVTKKPGWAKIEGSCRVALEAGWEYVWIDTCCIDKSSSAELQEAINSMFRWYEKSEVCIAYLGDVPSGAGDPAAPQSAFRACRWFRRGWTLQELLAPRAVVFFNASWGLIGTSQALREVIEEITGIRQEYFKTWNVAFDASSYDRISRACVAERMSWAATRETTRKEDMAYCLLGIFDINMTMLYGEGTKAFQRLQEEIMKVTDDSSLLAWGYGETGVQRDGAYLLAPEPASFKHCGDFILHSSRVSSFSMIQRGLQLKIPVRTDATYPNVKYAILGCGPGLVDERPSTPRLVAVPLIGTVIDDGRLTGQKPQRGEYLRPGWCRPVLVSSDFAKFTGIRDLVIRRTKVKHFRELPFVVSTPRSPQLGFQVLSAYPVQPADSELRFRPTYPVQPEGSELLFTSTCTAPCRCTRQWTPGGEDAHTLTWESPQFTTNESSLQDCRAGQRIVHLRFPAGDALVLLEYKSQAGGGDWHHELRCRVFSLPGPVSLEMMHDMITKREITNLPELKRRDPGEPNTISTGEDYSIRLQVAMSVSTTSPPMACVSIQLADLPLQNGEPVVSNHAKDHHPQPPQVPEALILKVKRTVSWRKRLSKLVDGGNWV